MADWKFIDTQAELDEIAQHFLGDHDQEILEFYAKGTNEKYFPDDISRRGYPDKNLHVLARPSFGIGDAKIVELVFIACERVSGDFFELISLKGSVDQLRRITLVDRNSEPSLICARALYRWVSEGAIQPEQPYFKYSNSVSGNIKRS